MAEKTSKEALGLSNFYNCLEQDLEACVDLAKDQVMGSKMRMLRAAGFTLKGLLGKSGCKCFPSGTRVLMGDGSARRIEEIRVGDQVRATDPLTGASATRTVTRHIATEDDKHFNELTVETDQGRRKLTATFEHPFWSPTVKRWLEAGQLRAGEDLLTASGETVRVIENRSYNQHARTYNLTVEELHTYYVIAGTTPLLVHNADCDVLAPDLGDGWSARNPNTLSSDKGGCEICAVKIMEILGGGEVM
ncbi:polymorphic toxin-type HINT domain-containing protein [Streptomyces sp. NPDC051183]|uniref:polymorphic toxin-type HINT domain-containing protein n=1 Tax=Streptomyces sp. NPDC051183 TaxID=3155165 RepID=UPI0034158FE0